MKNKLSSFETETELEDYEQYLSLKSVEFFSHISKPKGNKNVRAFDNIVERNKEGKLKKKDIKSFIEELNYMIDNKIVIKALSKPFYIDILTGEIVLSCYVESTLSTKQLNKEYDKYLKIKQIKK